MRKQRSLAASKYYNQAICFREILKTQALTHQEFSKKSGICLSQIHQWATGKAGIPATALGQVCRASHDYQNTLIILMDAKINDYRMKIYRELDKALNAEDN